MAASAERDALVSAMLALREVARLAWDGKTRTAYTRAADAAQRAEAALMCAPPLVDGIDCVRCGGPVQAVRLGRPRRYCHSCRAPRTKAAS